MLFLNYYRFKPVDEDRQFKLLHKSEGEPPIGFPYAPHKKWHYIIFSLLQKLAEIYDAVLRALISNTSKIVIDRFFNNHIGFLQIRH